MNNSEIKGAKELLLMLSDSELMSLKDTVTKSLNPTNNRLEAIDACISFSQSPMELLRRKKIRRDLLLQYLARKSISISPGIDKVKLVKMIVEHWNSSIKVTDCNENDYFNYQHSSQTICPIYQQQTQYQYQTTSDYTRQLSEQFTEWFYTNWNNSKNFCPEHFFDDVYLVITQENRRITGSQNVYCHLRDYIVKYNLRFNPNINNNQIYESPHGLVMILVHGTIHQQSTCLGIFEQTFGLVRDPTRANNYIIKMIFLDVRTTTEVHTESPHTLEQQQTNLKFPPPTFVLDIMRRYDSEQQMMNDEENDKDDDDDDDDDVNLKSLRYRVEEE
ncbi:unnamed protein product [Didymodactylos carnosus]|uniref:NTF2 domain-containing protein n=1 Tax=Didymodactylos carnosus TaxID=1234261 RepID=A0A814K3E7_9BILA|nr:unnamed protein product [Didymodactylos carnosus]CAF3813994.1 unnamed protein product [Didymodactylos carnosus]